MLLARQLCRNTVARRALQQYRLHGHSGGSLGHGSMWANATRVFASRQPRLHADTDIDATLKAAAEAAGVTNIDTEQLGEHLRNNWYSTAGHVAVMSKQELQQLQVPVKLWAVIKAMVAGDGKATAGHADTAAAADMEARAAAALAGNTAEASAAQQLGPQLGHAAALPANIMDRRMPANLSGRGAKGKKPVLVRTVPLPAATKTSFTLRDEEMTPELQADFEKLQHFSCSTFYGQRVDPLRPVSFKCYKAELRMLLAYIHRVKGVPLPQLRLSSLVPSPGREGVSLLMEYQHWRQAERGTAPRSLVMPIKAAIALCRYLYHEQSEPATKPPYRDLPVVQELANMLKVAQKAAVAAPLVSDESKKWLSWDEYLDWVRKLHAECAGLTASGKPRVKAEIATSLQRYLVVAILSVVPDRQRTLRELEVGRTLVKREDGTWVIKHTAADYKTGKRYGDRPPLVIAPFIYPELEAYIDTWRQELNPKTTKLFCAPRTGREHTDTSMWHIFNSAALRLTGKATNPHLVRDMIVTHLREQGASEQDMESLAMLMAHSVKEQRSTYDRRTKAQKVQPAVDLMLELSQAL